METDLKRCSICPRKCMADRTLRQPEDTAAKEQEKDYDGAKMSGFCGMSDAIRVARAALHMWEEPCISGEEGSGAVFFSGCNLRCVFCQNYDIAAGRAGKVISEERLCNIFMELQEKGANNINLVTPTHYITAVKSALIKARNEGLRIPVVYNSGGYESVESLKILSGLIDIYLPDFKYMSETLAERYSHAKDYPSVVKAALKEMFRQVGKPCFDERGIMTKGVIVRHLILPGHTNDSRAVIDYLYDTYGDDIYMSIMNQYTPLPHVSRYEELNRKVTVREYARVVDYAIEKGVVNAFVQEKGTAKDSFIPQFDCNGV